MKLKSIVINGANSYIAINLINILLENDFIVHAICRQPKKLADLYKNKNIFVYDYKQAINVHFDAETFIYFAWLNSKGNDRNSIHKQLENFEFLLSQLQIIENSNCKRVIFANSFYVKELNYFINNKISNINDKYNYAIVKNLLSQFFKIRLKGWEIIDLYISNVYGPNEKNERFITHCFNNWQKNETIQIKSGNGEFMYDFIYIDDAVDLIFKIMKSKKLNSSSYDVCSDSPKFFCDYLKTINSCLTKIKIENNDPEYPNPLLEIDSFRFNNNKTEFDFACKFKFEQGINEIVEIINETNNKKG